MTQQWNDAHDQHLENKSNVILNTGKITNNLDALHTLNDALEALEGQISDQLQASKLFCHQFIYTADIPQECDAILIDGKLVTEGGDRIAEQFNFPT